MQLASELIDIDAMLGDLSRAKKDYRHIVVVPRAKLCIFVNIDFSEARAVVLEQRRDLDLGFFAKMASGTRIDGDVARRGPVSSDR